jgi:hypothetical protein
VDTSGRRPASKTRGGKGQFIRTPDTADRDAEACRMRNLSQTYDEIATAMGFADRSAARKAVERAMLLTVQEPAAEQRAMQLAKLDVLFREAWRVLKAEHWAINNGRVIMDPRDPERALVDHGPVLAAINTVLKIEERRAKLLGLDAPTRVEAITVDMIEAEMVRLSAELGLNDRPAR